MILSLRHIELCFTQEPPVNERRREALDLKDEYNARHRQTQLAGRPNLFRNSRSFL